MMSSGCMFRNRPSRDRAPRRPKPYCQCKPGNPVPWKLLNVCQCGEDEDAKEWKWESPENNSWVLLSEDQKTVTFHPFYSSGTASVRGDMPMQHNYHYYWEVKMLSDTYGTDIMVGMCSDKASLSDSQFEFKSLLGQDSESYGLSYKGELRHSASVTRDSAGFCRGTIVGVRLDMWAGTMEFFINRKSQGVSFYNLRRHKELYPMVCSTAAQSSMRLIYAASWRASLQLEATKILHTSLVERKVALPPGLFHLLKRQVWLNLPDDDKEPVPRPTHAGDAAARAADVLCSAPQWVAKHPGDGAGLAQEVAAKHPDEDLWATPGSSGTVPLTPNQDTLNTETNFEELYDSSNMLARDTKSKQNDEVDSKVYNEEGASNSEIPLNSAAQSAGEANLPEGYAETYDSDSQIAWSLNLSCNDQNNMQLVPPSYHKPLSEDAAPNAFEELNTDYWYSSLPQVRYDPTTALPMPYSLLENT